MTFVQQTYDDRKCSMECLPGPCHCRDAYRPTDHPGGSLNTMASLVVPPRVSQATVNLDDDTPLAGGACDLGSDCESCQ